MNEINKVQKQEPSGSHIARSKQHSKLRSAIGLGLIFSLFQHSDSSIYANAFKLTMNQATGPYTIQETNQPAINLLQLDQQLSGQLSAQTAQKSESQAQWGFLKNIVNIDTFFASGPKIPKQQSNIQSVAQKQSNKNSFHSKQNKGKKTLKTQQNKKNKIQKQIVKQTPISVVQKQNDIKEELTEEVQQNTEIESNDNSQEEAADHKIFEKAAEQVLENDVSEDKNQKTNLAESQEQKDIQNQDEQDDSQDDIGFVQKKNVPQKQIIILKNTDQKNSNQALSQKNDQKQKQNSQVEQNKKEFQEFLKAKKEKEDQAAKVRNEGLMQSKTEEQLKNQEIDLEIEEPGAANKVAEEGSLTIQDEKEYLALKSQLDDARKKQENKIGDGGQLIELKNPKEFSDTMRIIVMHDSKANQKDTKFEKFETKDAKQAQTAAMAMQMTLETTLGALIVDDGQPGRESLIQNMANDESKLTSQIVSGQSIRNGLVQKMAPGDKMFYLVSYQNKGNKMESFKTRELADQAFVKMDKEIPRILLSGETGDILAAKGEQNLRDQCLGMFLTQRYQGKYYGKN